MRPTSPSTRSRISCAALLVNVIARISDGFACAGRDEVRDAVRQHARLARARAGQHQQRAGAVRDRLALRRVQALEQPLRAGGVASPPASRRAWARRPSTRRPGSGPCPRRSGRTSAGSLRSVPVRSATAPLELADPLRQARAARRRPGPAGAASRCPGPRACGPRRAPGWPGLPTTVVFGGTSWITTEFAPTLAPWPTVIGPSSFAPDADRDVVLDGRVALAARRSRCRRA